MKKLLADRLRESQRLTILSLIAALERRDIDDRTLRLALRDLGQELDSTLLLGELRWMERAGVVRLQDMAAGYRAFLTEQGDLAQRGVIEVPGIARPDLG